MEKITAILARKEPHFHTVAPSSSIENALGQMCCENVEYLVVIDEEERYIGIITEHDITSKVLFTHKNTGKTKVSNIMNSRLPTASTDDTVENCMQLMRQHKVRYLPVFENFSFRGIVSSDDILEEAVNNRAEIFDAERRKAGRFGSFI